MWYRTAVALMELRTLQEKFHVNTNYQVYIYEQIVIEGVLVLVCVYAVAHGSPRKEPQLLWRQAGVGTTYKIGAGMPESIML